MSPLPEGFSSRKRSKTESEHIIVHVSLDELRGSAVRQFQPRQAVWGYCDHYHGQPNNTVRLLSSLIAVYLSDFSFRFIALSFGMSLLVTAWVFFRFAARFTFPSQSAHLARLFAPSRITGAVFNPAVSLSLWLVGSLSTRRAIIVSTCQMVGGVAAAGLAKALTASRFSLRIVRDNLMISIQIGTFALGVATHAGISNTQGLFIECLTTALLCFTVCTSAFRTDYTRKRLTPTSFSDDRSGKAQEVTSREGLVATPC